MRPAKEFDATKYGEMQVFQIGKEQFDRVRLRLEAALRPIQLMQYLPARRFDRLGFMSVPQI